jgi:hypothetical protein
VKDPELAAFYGLTGGSGSTYTGFFNISFNATGNPPSAFTSSAVLDGNVINEFTPGPGGGTASLPSTALLIAAGLAAMVWSRRR